MAFALDISLKIGIYLFTLLLHLPLLVKGQKGMTLTIKIALREITDLIIWNIFPMRTTCIMVSNLVCLPTIEGHQKECLRNMLSPFPPHYCPTSLRLLGATGNCFPKAKGTVELHPHTLHAAIVRL